MKKYLYFLLTLAAILSLGRGSAQDKPLYVLDKTIPLPGDGGYDYVFIDQQNRKLYVSHGTTVNVVDLETEKPVAVIEGMQGNHGIAVATGAGRGFVSDGRANAVLAFDIHTFKTLATIPVTTKGPDGIIYDPYSNHVFVFCGRSNNVSVIDVNDLREITAIPLGGGPEFAVSDNHGKVYNNLEDKNKIKVIDTRSNAVIDSFDLAPCGGPTGLAIDSINHKLFTVCRENKGMSVIDIPTGKVTATVPIGAGVDAVAYDAKTKLVFCSNGDATTTIIRQDGPDQYTVVQTLATQTRAKTMALDTKTHKIYLSVADLVAGTRNVVPGTFKVLVYAMSK
ncbi:MAG TPA: YncE family protein [Puia sp.]|nr:YncE family protein [Puia sp.]